MSVIAFDGLTKRFGDVVAVDDLTVAARAGRVVGLLGPNGAGKTTTLRMLLGLVAPTAGSATIDGQPYRDLDEPIRHIGAVLEATSFHPGRRAREHLRVLAATAGLPDDRVDEVLADVALTAVARRRVGGFSLGMRQRLGLAAALLGEPEILVLDEPTNGLDPEGVRWLRDFVRGYAAAGHTVLVSSHLLAEVAQTVDEVVVLVAGRLVAHAPLSELPGSRPVVRIRTPQAAALRVALDAHGIDVRAGEPRPRARPRRHQRDRRTGHRRHRPRRLRDLPRPHRLGAGLSPPHHHADRSPTMNDLIRSELLKQRTVRLPVIALSRRRHRRRADRDRPHHHRRPRRQPAPRPRQPHPARPRARTRSSPAPRSCSASSASPASSATRRSPAPCSSHHAAVGS